MATYVCAQCGSRGVADPAVTLIDARYTTGKCPKHEGKQYLVREDVAHTEKKKVKRG